MRPKCRSQTFSSSLRSSVLSELDSGTVDRLKVRKQNLLFCELDMSLKVYRFKYLTISFIINTIPVFLVISELD